MKKTSILIVLALLLLGAVSCKKEKCGYYNDIMTYYDQSEEAWKLRYEQQDTSFNETDLQNQLYKIQRERENLQKQYPDCVEN